MSASVFSGIIPALMTPCKPDRSPDFDALVRKGQQLIAAGMDAVVYAGSMGDWPLLTYEERMFGVEKLIAGGVPVVVGTGAMNTKDAVMLAAHAQKVGSKGLMVIPRVLSRTSVASAQKSHFEAILSAAPQLESVIYNSPYYGFATRADLFFELRKNHPNLIGFKEFGGKAASRYAAEYMTSGDAGVAFSIGVDTGVFDGFVNCGAIGAITGIGNIFPKEILHLANLCRAAAAGHVEARQRAQELESALGVLSSFDELPDLVLYYKYMLFLLGEKEYELHINADDALTASQRGYVEAQVKLFQTWYAEWSQLPGAVQEFKA